MPRSYTTIFHLAAAAVLASAAAAPALATEVWSGRTLTFSKADFATWTLPENQDRITPNVWITRADTRGIFNIAVETAFTTGSPAGTAWATGDAVNHASLTFTDWRTWAQSFPPGTVGVNAVVHLITDDIYIDIRFDSWSQMASGGGFSYTRAVKPTNDVPPGSAAFALRGFTGNPARSDTPVEFTLPDASPARLEVLDVAGRLLAMRDVGSLGAGVHRLDLSELRSQPAGIVFVRLTRGGRSLVARAAHLR